MDTHLFSIYISVWKSVWTDTTVFQNRCEQIQWFSKCGVHWNQIIVHWFNWLVNIQCPPVFENQCEQIHWFSKPGVDWFDWPLNLQWTPVWCQCTPVFEHYCEQIHQFWKISVNRYTDFQKLVHWNQIIVHTDLID